MGTILALAYIRDTSDLETALRDISKDNNLKKDIKVTSSKSELLKFLRCNAERAGPEFRTRTGFRKDPYHLTTPSYKPRRIQLFQTRDSSIELFLGSSTTQESSKKHSYPVRDGAEFVRRILPDTPRVVLHLKRGKIHDFPNGFPTRYQLQDDFKEQLYHLPRFVEPAAIEACNEAMAKLVVQVIKNPLRFNYDRYRDILKPMGLDC